MNARAKDVLYSSDRVFNGVGADVSVALAGVPGDGPRRELGNVEPGARVNGLLLCISNR